MKLFLIAFSMIFLNVSSAQAKTSSPLESLDCVASGAIDGIVEVAFEESDLEGQVCGLFKFKTAEMTKGENHYACFNGSIFDDVSEMIITDLNQKKNEYLLMFSESTGFSLAKTASCDERVSDDCMNGKKILSQEKLKCTYSRLKI